MKITLIPKRSGNKEYFVVIGKRSDLNRVSHQTHEPIKSEQGQHAEHVDVPARKVDRINPKC